MKTNVSIALAVAVVLGLTGLLIWWLKFRGNESNDGYRPVEHLKKLHSMMGKIHGEKIDLPVIYINLDDATKRRELMEEQLGDLQVPVLRVPGVRAKGLSKRESAVKGCALAHLNAMREFLARG